MGHPMRREKMLVKRPEKTLSLKENGEWREGMIIDVLKEPEAMFRG